MKSNVFDKPEDQRELDHFGLARKGRMKSAYSFTELLQLPLFLGMGRGEMDDIQENVRLVSSHAKKGQMIVTADQSCDSLIIVVKGEVTCITRSDDNSYSMEEHLQAPLLIQPEHIFGIRQRYTMSYRAYSHCDVIRIGKQMVLKLMEISMTFRLNYLNAVTTNSQKLHAGLWHPMPDEIDRRVIRFIKDHTHYPAGRKSLRIKMNVMAKELGCSRLEVSEALHRLEDRQLIVMRRSYIEIPTLQLLLAYL